MLSYTLRRYAQFAPNADQCVGRCTSISFCNMRQCMIHVPAIERFWCGPCKHVNVCRMQEYKIQDAAGSNRGAGGAPRLDMPYPEESERQVDWLRAQTCRIFRLHVFPRNDISGPSENARLLFAGTYASTGHVTSRGETVHFIPQLPPPAACLSHSQGAFCRASYVRAVPLSLRPRRILNHSTKRYAHVNKLWQNEPVHN